MSCFGGWLAGNVTVGLVSKAPVTLIPVFSTTGASAEVGALPVGVELVDGCDEELDAADGEWELDEQALSEMTAASSEASSVGPPRNRARPTLPIDFHSVLSQAARSSLIRRIPADSAGDHRDVDAETDRSERSPRRGPSPFVGEAHDMGLPHCWPGRVGPVPGPADEVEI